jgi:hypothetical protein
MPVFVKQWIDGDFTLVFAKDLEDAVRIFEQTACVDEGDILQLNAGDLSVTFTLAENGELRCTEFTPAVQEARDACYPALVAALKGMDPRHVTDPAHRKLVTAAIEDEMEAREVSKLSQRMRDRKRKD